MKLFVPIFSITLLLSATLLFSVQPMFSKMILPMLGGTPQVWNTAMLFFQACLLGGYGYAHVTSRFLSIRTQASLHLLLLIISSIVLPFAIPTGWEPRLENDPTLWQLSLMAFVVGAPFLVISGSAPMIQHWFAASDHKDASNPYFLYGASNLGSMAALFCYPTIIEPLYSLDEQSRIWMFGYFALIGFTLLCALLIWKNAANYKQKISAVKAQIEKITNKQRFYWIMLSAIPSSLMLGVTTYITTDIATVPLLWIVPFALYVGTFIIVFARKKIISENLVMGLSGISILLLIIQMMAFKETFTITPLALVALHIFIFFTVTLSCHFDLAKSKPQTENLTEFYFFMSLGGVIGGFINAIIAPNFFIIPIEYALALSLGILMRYSSTQKAAETLVKIEPQFYLIAISLAIFAYLGIFFIEEKYFTAKISLSLILCSSMLFYFKDRWRYGVISALMLVISPLGMPIPIMSNDSTIKRDRNFFGVHKIIENKHEITLVNGVTNHGTQPKDPKLKDLRISYYGPTSPLTDVFSYLDQFTEKQEIGGLGLGIGVITCYKHPDRHFEYFEIDKDIADIAENPQYFTYLSGCGSDYNIIIGDGRLEIAKIADKKYDAVVVDVFSSDNIPVHIMTADAIKIYMNKLKDDGILVFHISNRYLDLEPVFTEIGKLLNIPMLAKLTYKTEKIANTEIDAYQSHFVVFTHNNNALQYLKQKDWSDGIEREGVKAWTDRYSNIISVLGNYVGGITRVKYQKKIDDDREAQLKATQQNEQPETQGSQSTP